MRQSFMAATILVVCMGLAQTGTAVVSDDAVVDFATTMDLPLVAVGNPGNDGEWSGESYGGDGPDRVCGAVAYAYNIGKFEVTAGQYTEFLNAVAATDAYGLYSTDMWDEDKGCKIQRSGSDGSYAYSVATDWEDRPVNEVSWGNAARFCNWLTNGMPTGPQGLATTEDGSYFLNGATSQAELMAVTREADARYVVPTEDEWYKAAYHKNDGVTGNYFDYATAIDTVPSNDLIDPDPGNNANFYDGAVWDYTIDSPYWRTEVGEFENSESPYNTFDMSGNVWEWNETTVGSLSRGVRGGAFSNWDNTLHASYRNYANPTFATSVFGFRVAEVPEPATMGLLALGGLALPRRRRR